MKQKTRSNLIYLAIGLGLAALLTSDAIYSDIHNRKMWIPSRFAFNAAASMGVLVFMVASETQKAKATKRQTTMCVFVATLLHWAIALSFPQVFAKPFYAGLWVFMVLEVFVVVRLSVRAILYLRRVGKP
jgi:riboflavin transporter FmnP